MQLIVTGAGVLLVLLVLPGGLARILNAARGFTFRAVARARGITLSGPGATVRRHRGGPGRDRRADRDGGLVTPLLECTGLEVSYGRNHVLHGVDLHAARPARSSPLLGTNGAGKSTLLRAISGLTPPKKGTVQLGGRGPDRAPTRCAWPARAWPTCPADAAFSRI